MSNQENLEEYFVFERYDKEGKIDDQSPFFDQNNFEHLVEFFAKISKQNVLLQRES